MSIMRCMKGLIFSAILMMVTHFAVGQQHDAFSGSQDPIKMVKIFPNPAVDYLSVKLETPSARTTRVTLHNIIGNQLEIESEVIDDFEIRLRVKDLPTGVYLLGVKDQANAQAYFKFIKR